MIYRAKPTLQPWLIKSTLLQNQMPSSEGLSIVVKVCTKMRNSRSSGFARRLERERGAAQELLLGTSLLTRSTHEGFASCPCPHLSLFPFHCVNSGWKAPSPALMPCTGKELHWGWGCRFPLPTIPSVCSPSASTKPTHWNQDSTTLF